MNEAQKQLLRRDIKEFNKTIEKQLKKISDLQNQKIGKFKNILLKILSFGLCNWNKRINNRIIAINETISYFNHKINLANNLLKKYNNSFAGYWKKCDDFKSKSNLINLSNLPVLSTTTQSKAKSSKM